MSEVISLINLKSGVGKTVSSINIACRACSIYNLLIFRNKPQFEIELKVVKKYWLFDDFKSVIIKVFYSPNRKIC